MTEVPAPIRALLGLIATVVEDAPALSDRALELPVLAVSTALQLSLQARQRYAALTVRGEEFLTQLRGGAPEQPPAWAKFDDDPAEDQADEPAKPAATSARPATPARKLALATPAPTVKADQPEKAIPSPRGRRPSAFDRTPTES